MVWTYKKAADFIIEYDPDQDVLGKKIMIRLLLNRVRANKPTVVLICGDSGEGKSYTALEIADQIYKELGIDIVPMIEEIEIFTPLEYVKKMDNFLNKKELKDYPVIIIDEAREVVKANLWHSFLNQAIADVNAMARGVKPIILFVVTQFIKDIDKKIRNTVTFYGTCNRPFGHKTRFKMYRLWKDDYDVESPHLRKRDIKGFVKKNKQWYNFKPNFVINYPRKELADKYEALQKEAKAKLIRRKMEQLLQLLEKEFKGQFEKVEEMANWYSSNPEALNLVVGRKKTRKGDIVFKVKPEMKQMHDMTNEEIKEFEKRILIKLANKGLASIEPVEVVEDVQQDAGENNGSEGMG